MTTEYNYIISVDFSPSGVDISELQYEISDNINISPSISHIYTEDDALYVVFSSELNVAEKIVLDSIITNHVPQNNTETISFFKINSTNNSYIKTTDYNALFSFIVSGKNDAKINSIKILSRVTTNDASYSVKIYDVKNNNVISEKVFSNTNLDINDMGVLNNLPSSESVFEIQAKRISGKNNAKVYIPECTIEYIN